MRKIALIIPFFHVGGVERWAVYIIKSLKNKGYDINLYVLGEITADYKIFGDINAPIKINYFDLLNILFSNSKPEIILTGLTRLNLFLSILGKISNIKVISSIHLALNKKPNESFFKYLIRIYVHKLIYFFSTAIICVSDGVKDEFSRINNNKLDKIFRIYNPCFKSEEIAKRNIDKFNNCKRIQLVAAGRLHHQKGFDMLIESFLNLPNNILENSDLTIFGSGDELLALQEIVPIGIKNKIRFEGEINNLPIILRKFDIYILSSRYEGFGNVLVEALAADCFCISFNIQHGPSEILKNGLLGKLVIPNDTKELTKSMEHYANSIFSGNDIRVDDKLRLEHLYNFTPDKFYNDFNRMLKLIYI